MELPVDIGPLLLGFAAAGAALLVFNAAIRYGLRAPRVANKSDPACFNLPFRNIRLATAGKKFLNGWLLAATREADDTKRRTAPALIVLHGWGGNSAMMLPLAAPFQQAGFTVLFIDARCHGASDDDTFASLPRFAEDMEAALDWLRAHDTERPIALLGHSVGAAAALLLASRRQDIGAVVSIAAFAHPESIMRRYLAARHIPYLPFGWYILRYIQKVIGQRFTQIAPQHTITRVTCPVLLVHGLDDETVPADDARQIHAARRDNRTRLLLVTGGHDDCAELEQRVGEVANFVANALEKN